MLLSAIAQKPAKADKGVQAQPHVDFLQRGLVHSPAGTDCAHFSPTGSPQPAPHRDRRTQLWGWSQEGAPQHPRPPMPPWRSQTLGLITPPWSTQAQTQGSSQRSLSGLELTIGSPPLGALAARPLLGTWAQWVRPAALRSLTGTAG